MNRQFLLSIMLIFVLLLSTGCLNKHADFSLPVYDATISGTVNYPLKALAPAGDTWVVVSTDQWVDKIIDRVKSVDGTYSFKVYPGKYYISAWQDVDNNENWSYGDEAIGGRLSHDFDLFRSFQPVAQNAATVTVNPVLLHPFALQKPEQNDNTVPLRPIFEWESVPGVEFYRIRVDDLSENSLWVFDTTATSVAYGKSPQLSGEVTLAGSKTIFYDQQYQWHVIGLTADAVGHREAVAYSRIWRFRTAPLGEQQQIHIDDIIDDNVK